MVALGMVAVSFERGTPVHQGTIIDRIDYNIERAAFHTKSATEQLAKAEVPYTPHPQPHTRNPTPATLHPKPATLHPTPSTLHPTPQSSQRNNPAMCCIMCLTIALGIVSLVLVLKILGFIDV